MVSPYSKDKDATWGFVGKATRCKGFKLFAFANRHGLLAWEVHGLGVSELSVAPRLIAQVQGTGYILADALHDTNELYGVCAICNHKLLAPRKRPGTGISHREHSPDRLRCIDLLERAPNAFGLTLYKQCTTIECYFGQMTNPAGGLGPLPSFVRKLPRVRRWVQAKLISFMR